MPDDLKAKAEVIRDLVAQGAEEVSIIGSDIKVVSGKKAQGAAGPTQIVYVQTQASAQSTTTLTLRLNLIRLELQGTYQGQKKLEEIEERLALLEKELNKSRPDKKVLKKIIQWALDFGWDVFAKIAPLVIDKVLSGS